MKLRDVIPVSMPRWRKFHAGMNTELSECPVCHAAVPYHDPWMGKRQTGSAIRWHEQWHEQQERALEELRALVEELRGGPPPDAGEDQAAAELAAADADLAARARAEGNAVTEFATVRSMLAADWAALRRLLARWRHPVAAARPGAAARAATWREIDALIPKVTGRPQ